LLLDIDHFKQFNDMYGHSTGDLVLRLVGRLLIENIKGRDIAARYGGEEFGVLLVGAEINAAADVARQICTLLASKRLKVSGDTESGHGRVTISIGVAQLRSTDSLGSVIDRADAALYAAKHAGRNCVLTQGDLMTGEAWDASSRAASGGVGRQEPGDGSGLPLRSAPRSDDGGRSSRPGMSGPARDDHPSRRPGRPRSGD
jgi:diguanylate cyclase